MRAVILAGGEGKRLRPLTEKTPKPLVRILTRPCMEYTVALLAHHGFTNAAVTTRYLANKIKDHFGESFMGVEMEYFNEDEPLGTAGGTKKTEKYLYEDDDPDFLVISGDTVCDYDLGRVIEFHRRQKSDLTLLLASNEAPLEYGVVLCDSDGVVTGFVEKPGWSQVFSNTVNTGIYVINKRVLSEIPENTFYDFSGNLFPKLLEKGYRVFGMEVGGYWCDIGSLSSYYSCNMDALHGRFESFVEPRGHFSGYGEKSSFIADGADVSDSASLCESIVSAGAVISDGAMVNGSILGQNVRVGGGSVIRSTVADDDVSFGSFSAALPGSVIGSDSTVDDGAYVDGSVICASSNIKGSEGRKSESPCRYDDDIVLRFPSPEKLVMIGRALARSSGISFGVVWQHACNKSAVYSKLIACGIASENTNALLFGEGEKSFASYAAALFEINCVFVTSGKEGAVITVFGSDGLSPTRPFERSIEQNLSAPDVSRPFGERIGKVTEITTLEDGILRILHKEMGNVSQLQVDIDGSYAADLVKKAVSAQGGKVSRDADIKLELYEGGLNICHDGRIICGFDKLRLLLIKDAVEKGVKEFYLPFDKGEQYESFIKSLGAGLELYLSHPTDSADSLARREYFHQLWLTNNLVAAARFIGIYYAMDCDRKKLMAALSALPDIYTAIDSFWDSGIDRASLLKRLQSEKNSRERKRISEGISLGYENGSVLIMPKKYGGLRIISRSFSAEAAQEMCDDVLKRIGELDTKI